MTDDPPRYPPTEALPLYRDPTIPTEAYDADHPDHAEFVQRTHRCFADHDCPYLDPSDVQPPTSKDTLDP
jgi:hypothetical protein